ncbi:MAG: hypothetical protein ABDK94_01520 [Atribacterota bacterium]
MMKTKEEVAKYLKNFSAFREPIMQFFVPCDLCGQDADWHIAIGLDREINLCYLCMQIIESQIQLSEKLQQV